MSLTLKTILGQVNNISFLVNENFDRLKNAVLLKDGSEPMQGNLDMNLYDILNVGTFNIKDSLNVEGNGVFDGQLSVNGNAFIKGNLETEGTTIIHIPIASQDDNPIRKDTFDNAVDAYQTADANLQAQLSGGTPLEASAFSEISWHGQVIQNSVTIPDNMNAWSFGPTMTIAPGQEVTIGKGSFWTIANGQVQ